METARNVNIEMHLASFFFLLPPPLLSIHRSASFLPSIPYSLLWFLTLQHTSVISFVTKCHAVDDHFASAGATYMLKTIFMTLSDLK